MAIGSQQQAGFRNRIVAALAAGNVRINRNGALFYNGTPAANNLFASDAFAAFTDRYGNAVLAGTTSYFVVGLTGFAMSLQGSTLISFTSPNKLAGPWTITASLADNDSPANTNHTQTWALSCGLVIQAAGAFLQGTVANPSTVRSIRGVAPGFLETKNIVSTFSGGLYQNSFTDGGTTARFEFVAIGTAGRVFLDGAVNTGAVNVAGAVIFNLPAGYRPARQQGFATVNNITAYVLGEASIQVNPTGDVLCVPASTAGKFVLLDGIQFSID